jgi:hypothetical protein
MTEHDQDFNEQIIEELVDRLIRHEETTATIIAEMRTQIADLQRRLPTEMMEATFPPYHEITQVRCQIFHSPNLTSKQLQSKSIWSPRFTIWRNEVRMPTELNVQMLSQHGFRGQLRERIKLIPPRIVPIYDYLHHPDNLNVDLRVIGSIIRGKPPGKGRPYLPSQGVVIEEFDSDTPKVMVWIDDHVLTFNAVQPAAGESAKSAKWFCSWRPDRDEVSVHQD